MKWSTGLLTLKPTGGVLEPPLVRQRSKRNPIICALTTEAFPLFPSAGYFCASSNILRPGSIYFPLIHHKVGYVCSPFSERAGSFCDLMNFAIPYQTPYQLIERHQLSR